MTAISYKPPQTKIMEYFAKHDTHDVLQQTHDIICDVVPNIKLRWEHNFPFYYYDGPLLYLGLVKKRPTLGFCKGVHLSPNPYLGGHGITVRHVKLCPEYYPPRIELEHLILEAVQINILFKKEKEAPRQLGRIIL